MNGTYIIGIMAVAFIFISGIAGCTYSVKINTEADTRRIEQCVAHGGQWVVSDPDSLRSSPRYECRRN